MVPPDAITPELLLHAYRIGVFPMAESRDDPEIRWIDPRHRGVLPLGGFHLSRSLARHIRRMEWQILPDHDFVSVVEACAAREETWINAEILALYTELHRMGHAHSLGVYDGEALVGGVYGVAIGGAFFGESMFSRQRDASKVALAFLVHRLRAGGFSLLDTQFLTPHLASLGGIEIPRASYHQALRQALTQEARFHPEGYCPSPPSLVSSLSELSLSGTSGATGGE